MTLISIDEHEARRAEAFKRRFATGIACPECGEELMKNGSGVLLCNPPKHPVICNGCNYTANILA